MFTDNYNEGLLSDKLFASDDFVDDIDYSDVSDESMQVANDIFEFLQDLIDSGNNDYENYEEQINSRIESVPENLKIYNLFDTYHVESVLHKLFEGNKTIIFDTACGLRNDRERVYVAINSWATDATTNYLQNTVNFIIRTPANKTVTIYPIDANYLESKLNSIFERNGFSEIHFNR